MTLRGRQLDRKTGQAIRHNNEPQGEDKKKKKKKTRKMMMMMKLYIYFLFLKNFCPSLADVEILSA